jgi:hypothetical protein
MRIKKPSNRIAGGIRAGGTNPQKRPTAVKGTRPQRPPINSGAAIGKKTSGNIDPQIAQAKKRMGRAMATAIAIRRQSNRTPEEVVKMRRELAKAREQEAIIKSHEEKIRKNGGGFFQIATDFRGALRILKLGTSPPKVRERYERMKKYRASKKQAHPKNF